MIEAYNQVQTRVATARAGMDVGHITLRETRIRKKVKCLTSVNYDVNW